MTVAAPSPRSEPLLWLQLLGLGLLPLEALLLLLLLGASDPGPLPLLERSLCCAIGVFAPAVALWRLPADPWSLLLAQVPQRGRREIQQRLSALQPPSLLRLASLVGVAVLSLVLLWWCDDHAAVASTFSPVAQSPRLVGLLLAAALLALLQWQGQQVVQALWLLSRPPQEVAAVVPMAAAALERMRFSPGLPLLLLAPLRASVAATPIAPPAPSSAGSSAVVAEPQPEPPQTSEFLDRSGAGAESPNSRSSPELKAPPLRPERLTEAKVSDPPGPSALVEPAPAAAPSGPRPEENQDGATNPSVVAIAVEPEQPAEEQQGSDLDQQVSGDHLSTGGQTHRHGGQPEGR